MSYSSVRSDRDRFSAVYRQNLDAHIQPRRGVPGVLQRQRRAVVLPAEMGKEKGSRPPLRKADDRLGAGRIGEMPFGREDAFFQVVGVAAVTEHFLVVVGLDDNTVQKQICVSMEQNTEPRNKPIHLQSINL